MMRRETRNNRWIALAAGAFATIVLTIWQNATTASLARHQAKLQANVETLKRELAVKRAQVLQAAARSTARAVSAADLGFEPPTAEQVVWIDLHRAAPQAADTQVARASIGARVMNTLLPSAGARVRPGSK